MSIKIPTSLQNRIANGEVIPLIGAGVSMSVITNMGITAFPSWEELLNAAAEKLAGELKEDESTIVKLQIKKKKFHNAAKEVIEGLQGRVWYNFLDSKFNINFDELNETSKLLPHTIWQLSNRVVTLNYDKVLSWGHTQPANVCAFDNANGSKLAEFTRNDRSQDMLWHLHGRIEDPKHIVLTPNSYHRLYEEDAEEHYVAALQKFKELISNNTLLFIGCSLDDAELLDKLISENKLFEGNTGPHYALVLEADRQTIEQKLQGNNVELLTFSGFGQPLIDAVQQLADCKGEQKQANQEVVESFEQAKEQSKQYDKISVYTASPLDKPLASSDIVAKLKKFKYPIYHQAFTERNLREGDDYSILFLLAKKTSNGLLIEDDSACSEYIAIDELQENLPLNAKLTVLITDKLLSEQELEQVDFPLLVLSLLNKQGRDLKVLDKLTHQLFKNPDTKHFIDKQDIQLVKVTKSLLESLNPENKLHWSCHQPVLPRDINSSELQGFTGRLSDLADISQKLAKAANGQRLLTIKGSGGLGKTTIAKKVAFELAIRGHFDGGVYFIDCENITSANQLEMHIGEAFNLRTAEDLFGYLAKHHDQRSRLLIFDNLESLLYLKKIDKNTNKQAIEQVKDLLSRTLIYSKVLVTSRESVNTDWEDILPFRQMESEEALSLFNHLTKNSYLSGEEQEFARRKVLEPLLNNNPLAIKLICDGMPKGKSLKELKHELEEDFFGKVKEEDLILMFDDEVDANINRQESIYISILYSYQTLTDSQKRAFESFSLFPDGIDLDTFKHLIIESKKADRNQQVDKHKRPMSDKDIAVLANKSLVEDYNGFYTLQSVIQRFARFQFEQHMLEKDKLELFRQAFRFNQQLVEYINELRDINNKAIFIFSSLFNNFLAAISYGAKKNVLRSDEELEDYFLMLRLICGISCELNLSPDFLATTNLIDIKGFVTEKNKEQVGLTWQVIEISSKYYKGEFADAYNQLKVLIPTENFISISGDIAKGQMLNAITLNVARHIYTLEGDAFSSILYDINLSNNYYRNTSIDLACVQIAMKAGSLMALLMTLVKLDMCYFEAQSYLNDGIDLNQLDKVIDRLHESEHLQKVNLTYMKSRYTYVSYESIDKLVNVNPYTRGLKKLMYAFSCEHELFASEDSNSELNHRVIKYYQSALPDLSHIKFYYVQAIYFYARFLQQINSQDFETVYEQGLELTRKHYYRYWQHSFLLLKQPSLGSYEPEDYPLPGNPDISPLIEKQIKWIKKSYGTSLNPFNQELEALKAITS
ncbi:SIR2 family protein [Pseudoalteromonas sp. 1_2015MBL_MicDiv]|uniref:SIR2 family protein n=1 Tax=Pseudoalteromonas sp. 1_2015MBL_MicDiv TaxID=1720343 RepID=UPI001E50846E|nr:SIR2 family protein [Pseudoalteromonas sp. 1_2015MBL_MicDiv]